MNTEIYKHLPVNHCMHFAHRKTRKFNLAPKSQMETKYKNKTKPKDIPTFA